MGFRCGAQTTDRRMTACRGQTAATHRLQVHLSVVHLGGSVDRTVACWRTAIACAALSAILPAMAADGDDRPVTATVGGRLHLDFARFDNDGRGTPNKDDTEIRRAWLDVSGRFFAVDYKMEADFSGDRVEAKDVFVSRAFGDAGRLTVGQFKQYFSLDDRTGSN